MAKLSALTLLVKAGSGVPARQDFLETELFVKVRMGK